MGMKGHAIIELTNTETGEKRTYEDDNMVTNFLEQFCIPTGPLNYNLYAMLASYAEQKGSTYRDDAALSIEQPHCFTKGLLLFENEIDEDADNIWPRKGNKMVGQATISSYSGSNARAGSYNTTESGPVENGYRYVWDFTTSQANGQISCACLTTPWGAIAGAGHVAYYSDYSTAINQFSSNRSQRGYNSQILLTTEGMPLLIDYDKKCSYQLKGICSSKDTTVSQNVLEKHSCFLKKEIRIRREKIPFDEFSIFGKALKAALAVDFEDLVFPMPQEIIDSCSYDTIFTKENLSSQYFNLNMAANSWGKHIYIYFAFANITNDNKNAPRTINAGDDLIIIDIDTEAETCNTFTVRNTTGSYIKTYAFYDVWSDFRTIAGLEDDPGYYTTYNQKSSPIFVTDKYVIMHTEDGKIYRISRADNTDVKAITLEGDEENIISFDAPYDNHSYRIYFLPLGKNVEQFNKNKVIGYRFKNNETFMFDFENATLSRILTNDSTFVSSFAIKILGTDLFALCSNDAACRLYGSTFPNFLTTINNLDTPVLKTSADTMKVTYIITNGDV